MAAPSDLRKTQRSRAREACNGRLAAHARLRYRGVVFHRTQSNDVHQRQAHCRPASYRRPPHRVGGTGRRTLQALRGPLPGTGPGLAPAGARGADPCRCAGGDPQDARRRPPPRGHRRVRKRDHRPGGQRRAARPETRRPLRAASRRGRQDRAPHREFDHRVQVLRRGDLQGTRLRTHRRTPARRHRPPPREAASHLRLSRRGPPHSVNPVARLRAWRRARILAHHPLADATWQATVADLPVLDGLRPAALERLRELATLFVHAKTFSGAHGLDVDDAKRMAIAAQACLPLLELGMDWLDGWRSVILYPDTFVVDLEEADEDGVVHRGRDERIGESWERGPLILSWADAAPGAEPYGEGSNVVIHEIAHKLDQRDGYTNGCPPLHPGMDGAAWRRDFQAAFDALCAEVDAGRTTWIDPYAAEAPEEFFAVLSEHFFTAPDAVVELVPAVYAQLRAFYRQDPLARLAGR
ncbi:MAG: hypothetical protein GWP66_09675 [Gammaproteobacteria bacterium]|nr:hypothetical protein [Gammaproteobacteria bacterium]